PVPPPRRSSPLAWLAPAFTVLMLCGLVVLGVWLLREYRARQDADRGAYGTPRPVTPRGALSELEKTNIEIYKPARPPVVPITTLVAQRTGFSLRAQEVPEGTGSGFIWDEGGHVVTNFHVIKNADAAQVILDDQSTYRATLVGGSPDND